MKIIPLSKNKTLSLPDCWEDLTPDEALATVAILERLFSGEIDPVQARLEMLFCYTGYKPNPFIRNSRIRENIHFNLFRLSEQLNFAFRIEQTEGSPVKRIVPQFDFRRNPLPFVLIDKVKYAGKIFNLDITAKTDIRAKEFVDAFDLYSAYYSLTAPEDKEECLNQLCAILYPACPDHHRNLVSGQIERMRQLDSNKKRLILSWFSGIVNFYTTHPVYSLLFYGKKDGENSDEKVKLGMNEVALYLTKEGYGNVDAMPLNDYFDAQIKSLKDTINKALSAKIKPLELTRQTGIPVSTIMKLS